MLPEALKVCANREDFEVAFILVSFVVEALTVSYGSTEMLR
jgi:hypothetical protein